MTQFIFHGGTTFEILAAKRRILIDPAFDQNRGSKVTVSQIGEVDLILVSAGSKVGDTVPLAAQTNAAILCGPEVKAYLMHHRIAADRIRSVFWGDTIEIADLQVQVLKCHRISRSPFGQEPPVLGMANAFLLQPEKGVRFFYSGPTTLFSDLKLFAELYHPNICAVEIATQRETDGALPGKLVSSQMTPQEAALAALWLAPGIVLPCGYISPNCTELTAFEAALQKNSPIGGIIPQSVALKPGEIFKFET